MVVRDFQFVCPKLQYVRLDLNNIFYYKNLWSLVIHATILTLKTLQLGKAVICQCRFRWCCCRLQLKLEIHLPLNHISSFMWKLSLKSEILVWVKMWSTHYLVFFYLVQTFDLIFNVKLLFVVLLYLFYVVVRLMPIFGKVFE